MKVFHPYQADPDRTMMMPRPMAERSATARQEPSIFDSIRIDDLGEGASRSWLRETGDYEPVNADYEHVEAFGNRSDLDPTASSFGNGETSTFAVLSMMGGLILTALVGLAAYIVVNNTDRIATDGVVVPSVVGYSHDDAVDMLTSSGFTVDVEFQEGDVIDPTHPSLTVVAQLPEAGVEHDPSVAVVLTVGTADGAASPEAFELPDVTGRTRADAEQALRDIGIVPQIQYTDLDPESPDIGYVTAQTPGAGLVATAGSEVLLLIGRAAEATATSTSTASAASAVVAPAATTPAVAVPQGTSTTDASTTQPSTTQPPSTTDTAADADTDGSKAFLTEFADTWSAGDWTRLQSVASPEAVAVAQEHHQVDGRVLLDTASLDDLLNSCTAVETNSTMCEILYGAGDGPALVFQITLTTTADSFIVSDLTFTGDAG